MSAPTLPPLRWAARSDTGVSRSVNQDFAYADPVPGNESWTLLAVADGVGGHANGEWASERAMQLIVGSLGERLQTMEPPQAFEASIGAANATLNVEAARKAAPGAATTFVAVLYRDGQVWWANVGDSRLYLVSEGRPAQISADHSWVADQVRQGNISPEAARRHPRRNVITRTVGFEPALVPDTGGPMPLNEGDVLVLCSDGLHGTVEDDEIARTVMALDPELAVERLVELANEAGGPDNITVVAARIDAPQAEPLATRIAEAEATAEVKKPRPRWRKRLAIGAGVVLVATVVAIVAAIILSSR